MIYLLILGTCLSCSIIANIILFLRMKKLPQTIEQVTRTETAESMLAEMLRNGAVNVQVYPGSDFFLRSPGR